MDIPGGGAHKLVSSEGRSAPSQLRAERQAGVARKDTENHYYLAGKDTGENEYHYSHTRHHPMGNAMKKLDKRNMYHVLERPGDVHKNPQEGENEYHVLEGPTPEEKRGGVKGSGDDSIYTEY